MTDSLSNIDSALPELTELIERRTTLQKWLAGLDSQRGIASDRILDRVRADYESRLASTVAALSSHLDGIRGELDRAIERAAAAEQTHDEAIDVLEEGRLRHTIGELPADNWIEEENRLVAAVERGRVAEEEAQAETTRLRELLAGLTDERARSGEATVEDAPALDPEPTVESGGAFDSGRSEEGVGFSGDEVAEQSEAFLAEIDRALSDEEAEAERIGSVDPDDVPGEGTAPKPGLKCGECGYTNDLSAWFCGVCGADVG